MRCNPLFAKLSVGIKISDVRFSLVYFSRGQKGNALSLSRIGSVRNMCAVTCTHRSLPEMLYVGGNKYLGVHFLRLYMQSVNT